MKRACSVRYREFIRESQSELMRRSNFIRIFPAKNTDIYECFFNGPRPYNKLVYKALYTDEILRGV